MKRTKPDYRRETQEIIESKKLSANFVMTQMGISVNTFYRWKRGESSPSESDFLKLKSIASGTHSSGGDDMTDRERFIRLEAKMDTIIALLGQRGVSKVPKKVESG